jgi:hypothetical protein
VGTTGDCTRANAEDVPAGANLWISLHKFLSLSSLLRNQTIKSTTGGNYETTH